MIKCFLLIAFISLSAACPAHGFNALTADLSVSQESVQGGKPAEEVAAGLPFSYNITLVNKDQINDALAAVLTIKMPYDATYVGADVYPYMPQDYSIYKSGDILKIDFERIAKASTRYVNISLLAPGESPDTLYSIAHLRYDGDYNLDDNIATTSTYVPLKGYNKAAAIKSFEDLLHNQSFLLFSFQDLVLEIPEGDVENSTFIASFEQLLRGQANLTGRFMKLLANSDGCGWDSDLGDEDRAYLLNSYENLLRDEAFLFAGFETKITLAWQSLDGYTAPGHSMDAQWEFLASLEDLLKRQVKLYKSFALLLANIDENAKPQERETLVDFLASYEDLLRLESNLIMSFEDLMSKKYNQTGSNGWEEYSRAQGIEFSSFDYNIFEDES
jgi:hypothetical protein